MGLFRVLTKWATCRRPMRSLSQMRWPASPRAIGVDLQIAVRRRPPGNLSAATVYSAGCSTFGQGSFIGRRRFGDRLKM